MEPESIVLILISAVIHAIWNLLAKKAREPVVFLWWTSVCLLALLPFLTVVPEMLSAIPQQGFVWLLASGFFHVLYLILLGESYKVGDLSLVYPIARTAPAIVAVLSFLFLKEIPTPGSVAGILLLVLGGYMINFRSFTLQEMASPFLLQDKRPFKLALFTALTSAGYSLTDKMSVSFIHPIVFFILLGIPRIILVTPYIAVNKKGTILREWQNNARFIVLSAVLMFVSYAAILFAMGMSDLACIISLRQVSILISVLLGLGFLKEGRGKVRLTASTLILLGAVLISVYGK